MKENGTNVSTKWYKRVPAKHMDHANLTIMYNLPIITDIHSSANRPDIVIHDWNQRTAFLIDVSVPIGTDVVKTTEHTQ